MRRLLVLFTLCISLQAQSQTVAQMKASLLALSDTQLFNKAVAHEIGSCYIQDATGPNNCTWCACDFYAKVKISASPGYQGLPVDTGCLQIGRSPGCTANVCGPDTVELPKGATAIRNALNESGDKCGLAAVVAAQTPPAGKTLQQLLVQNKIVFTSIDTKEAECYVVSDFTPVTINGQSVVPYFKKSTRLCNFAVKRFKNIYPGVLPTITPAADISLGIALGTLTQQQLGQVYSTVMATSMTAAESAVAANVNLNTLAVSIAAGTATTGEVNSFTGVMQQAVAAQSTNLNTATAPVSFSSALSSAVTSQATSLGLSSNSTTTSSLQSN